MGMESPNDYASMSFSELEANPHTNHILQEVVLDWLKASEPEVFEGGEFDGELDSSGYLQLKDGGVSNTKPSQMIQGNRDEVETMVRNALRNI